MKRPYPIFLCAKQKWRKFDDAWFITSPVGRSWLYLIVDKLTVSFHELKGKVLSNKIGMGFGITCLEEIFNAWEYDIEVTGHKVPISYRK
jgi:hypothetical protein